MTMHESERRRFEFINLSAGLLHLISCTAGKTPPKYLWLIYHYHVHRFGSELTSKTITQTHLLHMNNKNVTHRVVENLDVLRVF